MKRSLIAFQALLASSETNACRFGTQIPTQVLLERFEEGPPLTSLTPN